MQQVGIIGLGAVSGHHLRATKKIETAQLVAVADINRDVLAKVQQEYGCNAYSDYQELLQDEEVSLVIVCLPHFFCCFHTVSPAKRQASVNSHSESFCESNKTLD